MRENREEESESDEGGIVGSGLTFLLSCLLCGRLPLVVK